MYSCFIREKTQTYRKFRVARMLFISMYHRPGHCLASVERGAPNHDGVIVRRTDTANSDGRGWGGGVRVRECELVCGCVRACVMCLQYTIMIFYPG